MNSTERDPRVYFAIERTFLAWVRTGIALMGFGFVVARFGLFLREVTAAAVPLPITTPRFSLAAGVGMVLVGVAVILGSTASYVRRVRDFRESRQLSHRPSSAALLLSGVLALSGVGMAVYLLLFR